MRVGIVIGIIALLVIAGCGPTGAGPDRTVSFIGGMKGVEPALLDGMPPAAVYDNAKMPFGVGIALTNLGEADIGPGTPNPYARVSLEGFSPRAFGLTAAQMQKDIDQPVLGAKKNFDGSILPGQIASVIFEGLNYKDPLQGNYVQNVVVSTCFDYENFATAPICYKNEITQSAQDICLLTGEKLPQNSGGPLHVTSLVQNPLGPNKEMITFIVEHVGAGDFFGRNATNETCDPSVTNMNKNKVYVTVSSKDPTLGISCGTLGGGAAGFLNLWNGAPATVTCTLAAQSQSRIYTEPISINLRYRYGIRITQPIIIQAVGTRNG